MSLSSQIKVLGSLPTAGGSGGGGGDLSADETLALVNAAAGQVALARGGTGVDLSASGGATHFLAQAANHVVSARAIADGDLPAGSNAAAVSARLPTTGGTMTGAIEFSGSQSLSISSAPGIYLSSSDLIHNVNTGEAHRFRINDSNIVNVDAAGITIAATAAPNNYGIGRGSATGSSVLALRGVNNAGVDILCGSTSSQVWLSNYGVIFNNNHTTYGSTSTLLSRPAADSIQMQGAAAGVATIIGAGGGSLECYGSSHSTLPGVTRMIPKAISLANSAQRTVTGAATGRSGFVELVDLTNHRVARYSINAGVPTKDSGHSQFVAGAPGAGEVGLELSSTTLRVNNGSGGALLIAVNAMLAY